MLDISIAEVDQEKAKTGRFEHPDVHVQRRLHVLYFKSLGYAHKDICLLAGVSYTTIETVLKLYSERGLEEVCNVTYPCPGSALDPHRVTIEEYFRQNPPATVAEACKVIKDLTGVERKHTQVRHFLINLGMRPRKAGALPGKANPEKQEAFKKKPGTKTARSC
jgi:transposase